MLMRQLCHAGGVANKLSMPFVHIEALSIPRSFLNPTREELTTLSKALHQEALTDKGPEWLCHNTSGNFCGGHFSSCILRDNKTTPPTHRLRRLDTLSGTDGYCTGFSG